MRIFVGFVGSKISAAANIIILYFLPSHLKENTAELEVGEIIYFPFKWSLNDGPRVRCPCERGSNLTELGKWEENSFIL